MKKILLFIFLLFLSFSLKNEDELYSDALREQVYLWVANYMHIEPRLEISMPQIVNSIAVEKEKYKSVCDYCDNKRINFYAIKYNEIWLLPTCDAGSLAHEMAHYFQVKYRGETDDDRSVLEDEAIKVQTEYRKAKFIIKE